MPKSLHSGDAVGVLKGRLLKKACLTSLGAPLAGAGAGAGGAGAGAATGCPGSDDRCDPLQGAGGQQLHPPWQLMV